MELHLNATNKKEVTKVTKVGGLGKANRIVDTLDKRSQQDKKNEFLCRREGNKTRRQANRLAKRNK